MRPVIAVLALGAVLQAACARVPAASPAPPAVDSTPDRGGELSAAVHLARRGCYDCLIEALAAFSSLRDDRRVGEEARGWGVRTAVLLAVRENELGLVRRPFIDEARELLGPVGTASPELPGLVELGELLATSPPGASRAAATDRQLQSLLRVLRTQDQWEGVMRKLMPQDLLASYLWIGLVCGPYGSALPDYDRRQAVLGDTLEVPLLAYKHTTGCGLTTPEPAAALLAADPDFREINYHLGLHALGVQGQTTPDLDSADAFFQLAYAWRQDWPSLTIAVGNVAMIGEDFPRAFDFYTRTLTLAPDDPEALAGTIRALTYEDRHTEAIAAADRLVATGINPGEAHYWRALNFARLKEDDRAWADVERASDGLANADVPKLAGIIAINRREYTVARDRLELARRRRRDDCEVAFYLQSVLAQQREWDAAAQVAAEAGSCFELEEEQLRRELDEVRTAPMAEDRRARQIARREQQLASDARMRVTSWFNAAVASVNLSRPADARRFAEKVAADEQFRDRARALLEQIK